MPNMQNPMQNIVPPTDMGLAAPAQASVQNLQQALPPPVPALATPQIPTLANPGQMAQQAANMPNTVGVNPQLLQQVLSTMLLQPQNSIGSMMQPRPAIAAAQPAQAAPPSVASVPSPPGGMM